MSNIIELPTKKTARLNSVNGKVNPATRKKNADVRSRERIKGVGVI